VQKEGTRFTGTRRNRKTFIFNEKHLKRKKSEKKKGEIEGGGEKPLRKEKGNSSKNRLSRRRSKRELGKALHWGMRGRPGEGLGRGERTVLFCEGRSRQVLQLISHLKKRKFRRGEGESAYVGGTRGYGEKKKHKQRGGKPTLGHKWNRMESGNT